MISKELKSQLSILKETNPEYIQTLKDAVTASYKAELQAIKPSSTEEEEQLNIELKDIVLKILFGPFYNYFVSEYVVSDHTKEYTEGFTEEMVIPYRTEELNPYLRYPNQEINNNHLHSEHIRLQIREMLQIPLSDITIIDIISLP